MPIYENPVWKLMYEMVDDFKLDQGNTFKKEDAVKWFSEKYPLIKSNTVTAHLIRLSTNAQPRTHYKAKPGDDDLLFKVDSNTFRLYKPDKDPLPIYEFKSGYKRIINKKVDQEPIINFEIFDEQLRKRMESLKSALSDTIIREAGVVLEDRLRTVSEVEGSLFGKKLVDAVLNPEDGLLKFSDHHGEQDGVRMLYSGAMQFIRNPAMHKLIDYSDHTTRIFIQLIDSLLQLLTELNPQHRGRISVDTICEMIKRRKVPPGQIDLYKELIKFDKDWVSASDLAVSLNRSRSQLAGVLGALGNRINKTEGLEGRGGVRIVIDNKSEGDEIYYRMRKILKDALEKENINGIF